jgi:hypothetical protein
MAGKKTAAALTDEEKRVAKALLAKNWRNQDIQALVNIGRPATVNSGRITGVKQSKAQEPASDEEVAFFRIKKRSYDPQTGLNFYDDERLIRAREAMILAVQIFNSAALKFKTEVFAVLANVAWTYLLHEYYDRRSVAIVDEDGRSLLLSKMIERPDCPISDGVRNNLRSLKTIRDDVEHLVLGKGDLKFLGLFQACCLNFDRVLCKEFGERLTLANDLAVALQFTRMDIEQLATVNKYEIPSHIDALDARLTEKMTEAQQVDLEYQFRVIYTLDAASKTRAHFEFFRPESAEGKEIRNVLVQYKSTDESHPHKAGQVPPLVAAHSGKAFTSHNHVQAWRQRLMPLLPVRSTCCS